MLKLKDLKEIDFEADIYICDTNTKLGFDVGNLSDRNIKKFGEYEVASITPSSHEEDSIDININFFDDEELEKII